MSKITGIIEGNNLPPKKNIGKVQDDQFKNTLDKAIKIESQSKTEKTDNRSLGEIQTLPLNSIEDLSSDFQDKTNQLLDLIESYARDLGNPDKTLKEIEPKVKALKKGAEELMEKAEKIPHDKVVHKIATESAMAANVEYIKFNRGDYI